MKKFLLRSWPIACIFLLWFVFSAPFFIKGQIPFAGDYQVTFFAPWSQYDQFARPVRNNAMPDVIDQLYPWKHLVISDWKSGEVPLWNPYQFAGTPLLANYQSAAFSPMNILFFILPFTIAWSFLILLQPLFIGLGMYFFLRKLSISQLGSILSAISLMFCSFVVTWMGYGTLGYAVSALPFVFLGIEGYIQSKKFSYLLLLSISLAFSFLSGHFQMSLYVLLAGALYILFYLIFFKDKKALLYVFLALVGGLLLASVQIFPSIAFYAQSLRSNLFERPEIIPWQYFITLLAPDFLGNPVTRNDWFGHYAEWGSYIGIIPLVFAIFSLTELRKKHIAFFTGLSILAIFLAAPSFLGNVIIQLHIPVLSTSAAGRVTILLSFSLAVLAGFGLDRWIESSRKKQMIIGFTSVVLLLIGWIVIVGKLGLTPEHVLIAKSNFFLPTILLFAIILASGTVFLIKNKKVVLICAVTLFFLSSFDMYRFAAKWQSFSPQALIFPNIPLTTFFQSIKNSRTLGNYGGQVSLYYQLPAIEGYDPLYPEHFGEFASFVGDGKLHAASRSVVDFPKNGKYTKEAVDLLGVAYIVHKVSDSNKPWAFPVWKYPQEFMPVYTDSQYVVFKNKSALPRAFLVGDYVVKPNGGENLATVFSSTTDRSKTITLDENPNIDKIEKLISAATITSYQQNVVVIQTTSSAKALLFLSDTYFPGWKAYVDGKLTKIYRADFAFRAIVVPSGKHTVRFVYMPDDFIYGTWSSLVGIIFIGLLYFFQKRRDR